MIMNIENFEKRVSALVSAATRIILPSEPPATVEDGLTMVAVSQATIHCLLQRDLSALARAKLISDEDYEHLAAEGLSLALKCKMAMAKGLDAVVGESTPTPTAPGSDRKDH